jgi:hypothetical protein
VALAGFSARGFSAAGGLLALAVAGAGEAAVGGSGFCGFAAGLGGGTTGSGSSSRSRRSRAPPGSVLLGSPSSPAGCVCLPSLSTKGSGVYMIVIATHTAITSPTIRPMITPATVPPRCQRRPAKFAVILCIILCVFNARQILGERRSDQRCLDYLSLDYRLLDRAYY